MPVAVLLQGAVLRLPIGGPGVNPPPHFLPMLGVGLLTLWLMFG